MAFEGVDSQSWNEAVLRHNGSLLQSLEWGEFQASLGREVVTLRSPAYQALVVRHSLPLGKSYLYCPRGPVFLEPAEGAPSAHAIEGLLEAAAAEKQGAIFLKIEPELDDSDELSRLLQAAGFTRSRAEIQPSRTIIVDIARPEDEILGSMKSKTRYNIRLAQKKGLAVKQLGPEYLDAFLGLLAETAGRDEFRLHPEPYYRKMLDVFLPSTPQRPSVELWGAEHEGELLAVNLVMFWGGRASYLHGASSSRHRNLMAPYLLHWEIIRRAREAGCSEYDLWGISQKWPGVTRFKEGFGGKEVVYAGSHDFVFQKPWYLAYRLSRRIL